MLSLTVKEMRGHGRRLVGTAVAVFLGVAFLAGTLVLGDTLRNNFDNLFAEVNAGTDVVVRNTTDLGIEADEPRGLIDRSLVDRVAAVDGVAAAEPQVQGLGQLLGADGDAVGGGGPPQLAGSWTADEQLNPYRLAEGRAPEADDEVVINRGAADKGDLHIGDRTTVLTPEPVEVTIVGISTFGDQDGLGGVTFTAFSLEGAMEHVTKDPNGVSTIAVRADDGTSQSELVSRVDEVLPNGVEAVSGSSVSTENADDINELFLDMLTRFLTVFAGIALLVATFSIYNTFSIIVAQRTRTAALLRAIGASRRQVLASVVIEAAAVGVVASLAGVAGGIAVAGLLKGLFDAAGFALPAGGIVVTGGAVIVSVIVGLVVTLLAGIVPAVKASRVPPLAALRDVAVERTSPSAPRIVAGAILTGLGAATTAAAALSDDPSLATVGLGAVITLLGAIVLGPVVARPVAGLLGAPLARVRGLSGSLARQNAIRNPRRTAATASALMVGVGIVTLFTVFAASLKESTAETIDRSFAGDLVISSGPFGGSLSPDLAVDVGDLPEVDSAVGIGRGFASIDGDTKQMTVADPADLAGAVDVGVTSGSVADMTDDDIAISDATADANGWGLGDTLPVTFADGARADLTVAATYDVSDIVGGYVLPSDTYAPHTRQPVDSTVVVDLSEGTSLADGKAAVDRVAANYGGPDVEDRDEFAATMSAGADMFLTIIYALLALAIIIALMGIANTLSLSIHERTRELGLLRAVGQTRAQLRSMVRWESVIVATFGVVGGIGLGVFLGWALVEAAGNTPGSVISEFVLPVARLAIVVVVGAIAGVLAGLRPARRAARLDVLGAIATE
ncbi:MAG TPA: FtsX-like permease family protein [Acidimicrobiales bacterium]|nr:FtsX-like permease family protein [Acidimicrobiales bacterium]